MVDVDLGGVSKGLVVVGDFDSGREVGYFDGGEVGHCFAFVLAGVVCFDAPIIQIATCVAMPLINNSKKTFSLVFQHKIPIWGCN